MTPSSPHRLLLALPLSLALASSGPTPLASTASAQQPAATTASAPATAIPDGHLLQPGQLLPLLAAPRRPLVLQVGPHVLYSRAHIPGAEYVAPAGTPEGAKALRDKVARLPKGQAIVLYCGCCPWDRCPNAYPAFHELQSLGFTAVRVLYLPGNFASDWIAKGYPLAKGG